MNDVVKREYFDLQPTTFEQAMKYAELIANSSFAPKDFKGKPGDILIAIQMGYEINLKPLQAIQNIAVINGRPCVWGDAQLAVVKASSEFEYIDEYDENETAHCKLKRKGQPELHHTFSMEDAKKAGLLGKDIWIKYPKRMRQMRARGFALRDGFPDVLKGIISREEAEDYPTDNISNTETKAQSIKTLLINKNESSDEVSKKSESENVVSEHNEIDLFTEMAALINEANNNDELKLAAEKIKNNFNGTEADKQGLRDRIMIRAKEIKEEFLKQETELSPEQQAFIDDMDKASGI